MRWRGLNIQPQVSTLNSQQPGLGWQAGWAWGYPHLHAERTKVAARWALRQVVKGLCCPEHRPSSAQCTKSLSLFSDRDGGEQLLTLSVQQACQMFADPRFFLPRGSPTASKISRGEGCASSQASPGRRERIWGGVGLRAVPAGHRA